jgi:probable F420-dependent oxidoreductase
MRFGLSTPIVVQQPGVSAPWESNAGITELTRIARLADQLGYHHLGCSEHVAVPVGAPTSAGGQRGATYWDPLATLGYLAACTETIRLATTVLVLGYHHPLSIAKRYGTLDAISGGRVILGLGVGSLREEFDLLGAEFTGRGARADDAIRALRASLSRSRPSYAGSYYDFDGFAVEPHAVQQRVPLWVGGHTRPSLRRAVELADGWSPFGLSRTELGTLLAGTDRPDGFDVVLGSGPLDPIGEPSHTGDTIGELDETGATVVNIAPTSRSLEHYLEQLESFQQLVASSRHPTSGSSQQQP